jgi:hypothetical protein
MHIRVYEPRPPPAPPNLEDDWDEFQRQWNVPLERRLKFVDGPHWVHHHLDAYQRAIDALRVALHSETAECFFIPALEQYICDTEETPKHPWVGVVHGIADNPASFYVPNLRKLCTQKRFK